jgi:16S rRNA (guanine527-N7)-methyltransferase
MSVEIFRRALAEEAASLRIDVPAEKLGALCDYYELLCKWNRRIRLVGTIEPKRAAVELFADSLVACEFARSFDSAEAAATTQRVFSVIDIGSGAGLPGTVAKIMASDWNMTLVESDAKKVVFLNQLSRELGLSDIQIERGRAEQLAREPAYRQKFDLAFCRAVAAPATACELAVPFLKIDGSLIIQTTVREEAAEDIRDVADVLGASIDHTMTYVLSATSGERMLIQIRKITETPEKFPRDFRSIKKKPLA